MPGPALHPTAGLRPCLFLLGGLSIRAGEREIALPTVKSRLLLAHLACAPGRLQPRARLCALLWEDRAEDQARGSLRNALSHIRTALGEDALIGNREAVGLNVGAVDSDLARLEAQVATGDIIALTGTFLDGIEAGGAMLHDWLEFERSRCRTLAQKLLEQAANQAQDHDAALVLARRLVDLDPYREASHRRLMRVLAASGDRALALAQFRTCRDLLRSELGIAPSAQTQALADELSGQPAPALQMTPDFHLSIAVLPFADADGDEDGRYLAEGLADDIMTELTRHRDILVIARQSSFQLAGMRPGEAAQHLGTRYVLTGSVRRRGDRLALSMQLLDAATGRSVSAERYERPYADLFAMQDTIVAQILASVDAGMRQSERERAAKRPPSDLDAWQLFHRGLWHAYRFLPDEADRAEAIFARAAALAPDFALPPAGLAYVGLLRVTWRMAPDPKAELSRAIAHGRAAVETDPTSPFAQVVLGRLLTYAGQSRAGFDHLLLARELNPSYAATYYGLATACLWTNQPEAALTHAEQALRLSPRDPLAAMFLTVQSFARLLLSDPDAAAALARRAMELQPREIWSRLALACALVEKGDEDTARQTIGQARRDLPDLSLATIQPLSAGVVPEVRDRIFAALGQAGLS